MTSLTTTSSSSSEEQAAFFILRKIKYLESDLIVHALSSTGQKMSFLARGGARSKKRFGGGVLEPTHQALLTYQRSQREGALSFLREAQILHDFSGIRRSYETLEFALQAIECMDKVSQEGDMHSEVLYNLLGHTLTALETTTELPLLKLQFYLKFLLQQGVLTLEPWMNPYLKTQIQNHSTLYPHLKEAEERIPSLEVQVRRYIETASLS